MTIIIDSFTYRPPPPHSRHAHSLLLIVCPPRNVTFHFLETPDCSKGWSKVPSVPQQSWQKLRENVGGRVSFQQKFHIYRGRRSPGRCAAQESPSAAACAAGPLLQQLVAHFYCEPRSRQKSIKCIFKANNFSKVAFHSAKPLMLLKKVPSYLRFAAPAY